MVGLGLVESLKRVWKVKSRIGDFGVSGLECSSSTTAPPLALMVAVVAQTSLSVTGDSFGRSLMMVLSPVVEEGVIVARDVEK